MLLAILCGIDKCHHISQISMFHIAHNFCKLSKCLHCLKEVHVSSITLVCNLCKFLLRYLHRQISWQDKIEKQIQMSPGFYRKWTKKKGKTMEGHRCNKRNIYQQEIPYMYGWKMQTNSRGSKMSLIDTESINDKTKQSNPGFRINLQIELIQTDCNIDNISFRIYNDESCW